jgi:hypothetical protein
MRYSALAVMLTLAACDPATLAKNTSTFNSGVSTATADLQSAVDFYGFAKGAADLVVLVKPQYAAPVAAVEAKLDPLVAQAQTYITNGTTDIAAAEALVTEINTDAKTLQMTVATQVTVTPNK